MTECFSKIIRCKIICLEPSYCWKFFDNCERTQKWKTKLIEDNDRQLIFLCLMMNHRPPYVVDITNYKIIFFLIIIYTFSVLYDEKDYIIVIKLQHIFIFFSNLVVLWDSIPDETSCIIRHYFPHWKLIIIEENTKDIYDPNYKIKWC